MRAILLFLSLVPLIACGKVVDSNPNNGSAGAGIDSIAGSGGSVNPAAGAGTGADPGMGGSGDVGGGRGFPTTARDAGPAVDASTPHKPGTGANGDGDDAGTASTSSALCDGSARMRLAYESNGGFVRETFFFTNPHGHAFFAIDGMCRFYAASNYMRGIASGTLSQADADALTKDIHWIELSGWTWNVQSDQSCADAGGVTLTRANSMAGCTCGCDPAAPKGLDDALANAAQWVDRLIAKGKPLDGAVSAIALPSSSAASLPAPIVDWPLARAMSSIPALIHEGGTLQTSEFARFDDPAEYTKLREARVATVGDVNGSGSWAVPIQEGSMRYDLYIRDELPDAAAMGLAALQGTPLP